MSAVTDVATLNPTRRSPRPRFDLRSVAWPEPEPSRSRLATLEAWLQLNMAAVIVVASGMLGAAQGDYVLPVIVAGFVVVSLIVTDRLKWLQIPRVLGNVIALVATVYVLWEFILQRRSLTVDQLSQLYTIANLLVYLQIVILFNRKRIRVYWHLLILSLLQVVVGAAQRPELIFGVAMTAYLVLAVSAGLLFQTYRETLRVLGTEEEDRSSTVPLERTAIFPGTADQVASRWWTRRLSVQMVWALLASLLAGGLFFIIVPRPEPNAFQSLMPLSRTSIGFTQQIDLSELRDLQDDPTKVMRVSYINPQTGNSEAMIGSPYLRGAVLTEMNYDRMRGDVTWRPPSNTNRRQGVPLSTVPPGTDTIVQDIQLEPIDGEPVLFSVFPAYRLEDRTPDDVRFNPVSQQLIRVGPEGEPTAKAFRYALAIGPLRGGLQPNYVPETRMDEGWPWSGLDGFGPRNPFQFSRNPRDTMGWFAFPNLTRLANEIVEKAGLRNAPRHEQIQAYLLHFLQDGRYQYSLELSKVVRDRDLNPIEDFVLNHRTGQCEYFATALCLMLRSQQIPSRIVVGYRPEEYNSVGQFFQVRQRDAHAWVEAYLSAEEAQEAYPEQSFENGIWVRLDPTPLASSAGGGLNQRGWFDQITQGLDYLQFLWSDYVVTLDRDRQRAILGNAIQDDSSTGEQKDRTSVLVPLLRWMLANPRAATLVGVVAVVVVLGGTVGIWLWRQRRFERRIGGIAERAIRRRRAVSISPLIERWHAVLERQGWLPVEWRSERVDWTERDLLEHLSGRLDEASVRLGWLTMGRRLVDAYQTERFGGRPLDSQTLRELETDLSGLERGGPQGAPA